MMPELIEMDATGDGIAPKAGRRGGGREGEEGEAFEERTCDKKENVKVEISGVFEEAEGRDYERGEGQEERKKRERRVSN